MDYLQLNAELQLIQASAEPPRDHRIAFSSEREMDGG
jgi:hypothetical protein